VDYGGEEIDVDVLAGSSAGEEFGKRRSGE
jgi:hypothetical protein